MGETQRVMLHGGGHFGHGTGSCRKADRWRIKRVEFREFLRELIQLYVSPPSIISTGIPQRAEGREEELPAYAPCS